MKCVSLMYVQIKCVYHMCIHQKSMKEEMSTLSCMTTFYLQWDLVYLNLLGPSPVHNWTSGTKIRNFQYYMSRDQSDKKY